jgi:hypothetical protein
VSASLQSLPILEQFPPVDLRPCDDQARLAGRETPPNDFDVVDRKYSDTALVIGVEMGPMVWSASLHEHPDNNPEEAADLRQRAYSPSHELLLYGGQLVSQRKVPRELVRPAFGAGILHVSFTA